MATDSIVHMVASPGILCWIVLRRETFPLEAEKYLMPLPLKAAMLTKNNLGSKMWKILRETSVDSKSEKEDEITCRSFIDTNSTMRQQICEITKHFDYILTTNYSYGIGMALLDVDVLSPEQIKGFMNFHEVENAQRMFLINT